MSYNSCRDSSITQVYPSMYDISDAFLENAREASYYESTS